MSFRTFFNFLNSERSIRPFRRGRCSSPGRRTAPCRLSIESLEDRCVPATLAIGDATVIEGSSGAHYAEVSVTLDAPANKTVRVSYSTADGYSWNSATAGSDYDPVSGTLTFAKGETNKTILVPVIGDRIVEFNETFFVQLSGAKGAKIGDGQGVVTIADDEPRIIIDDMSAAEDTSGTTPFMFRVSLLAAYDLPVSVNYTTADGSARAGIDYTAASGTLTFAPGQTKDTIEILVNGDRVAEPDKTFFVNVSSPDSYARIGKGQGIGTIIDSVPRISITDAYNYSAYGETSFTFTVSLSVAYDQVVTVDFATADGTAIAGVDYVAASGTLTFAPGETVGTITVEMLDLTYDDSSKYFSVHLGNASTDTIIVDEVAVAYWYIYDPCVWCWGW